MYRFAFHRLFLSGRRHHGHHEWLMTTLARSIFHAAPLECGQPLLLIMVFERVCSPNAFQPLPRLHEL
jgi:hypothetical protein